MEVIVSTIIFFLILVWAFRLEIGIAKANESLKRIEEHLNLKKKEK